jgi:hypothetical protein
MELMDASTVTVMESPARMMTSLVEAGTAPPGHGALTVVELQLPLPAVVIVAAKPGHARAIPAMMASHGGRAARRRRTTTELRRLTAGAGTGRRRGKIKYSRGNSSFMFATGPGFFRTLTLAMLIFIEPLFCS